MSPRIFCLRIINDNHDGWSRLNNIHFQRKERKKEKEERRQRKRKYINESFYQDGMITLGERGTIQKSL